MIFLNTYQAFHLFSCHLVLLTIQQYIFRLDIKFPEEPEPEPEVKEGGEEVKEGEEAAKDGSAKEGEAEAKEGEDKAKEEKVDAVMEESVADSEAKVNGEKVGCPTVYHTLTGI